MNMICKSLFVGLFLSTVHLQTSAGEHQTWCELANLPEKVKAVNLIAKVLAKIPHDADPDGAGFGLAVNEGMELLSKALTQLQNVKEQTREIIMSKGILTEVIGKYFKIAQSNDFTQTVGNLKTVLHILGLKSVPALKQLNGVRNRLASQMKNTQRDKVAATLAKEAMQLKSAAIALASSNSEFTSSIESLSEDFLNAANELKTTLDGGDDYAKQRITGFINELDSNRKHICIASLSESLDHSFDVISELLRNAERMSDGTFNDHRDEFVTGMYDYICEFQCAVKFANDLGHHSDVEIMSRHKGQMPKSFLKQNFDLNRQEFIKHAENILLDLSIVFNAIHHDV